MKHLIPFRKPPLVLAITASLASPTWVQAAPGDPLGPEFRVNTFTINSQGGPTVAMDTDGSFVVAWTSDGRMALGGNGLIQQTLIRHAHECSPSIHVCGVRATDKCLYAMTIFKALGTEPRRWL